MEVSSLLNMSVGVGQLGQLGELGGREPTRRISAASSTPSATAVTTAASTAVPAPSPGQTSPSGQSSGSRSPTRNRKPWDGGGYSLPLTIDTKSIPSPPITRPTYSLDSPTDVHTSVSPNSPGHKYSHSRSSLSSSYTSSSTTNSGSHSRISSLSTLGEYQAYPTAFSDISLDNSNKYSNFNFSKMADRADDPTASGDGDASRHQTRAQRLKSETIDLTADQRPESPSDAVMIRRGQAAQAVPGEASSPIPIDDDHNDPRDNSPSSVHRRAISAPDNAITNPRNSGFPSALLPMAAVTGTYPNNPFGLSTALISSVVPRLFETVDDLMKELDITEPKSCRYMEDCQLSKDDANANWRKAMSHLFGRNKNCTRCIPENVWILLCRKHYQRARYRNNLEYNKRLCGLVEVQVLRVEAWSNLNQLNGTPDKGVVVNWNVVCRRREQMRIDEEKEAKSKKRAHNDDDDVDAEPAAVPQVGNTVPQWLIDACRPGYTALEIMRIVARIHEELAQGIMQQLPDVEILPNISGDNAKPKGAKSRAKATKTPTAPTPHRRVQSMSNAAQAHDNLAMTSSRRMSEANHGNGYRHDDESRPTSKRLRLSEAEEDGDYDDDVVELDSRFPPRTAQRIVPNVRPQGPRYDERTAHYDYHNPTGQAQMSAPRPYYHGEASSSRSMGNGYDEYRARVPTHQRAFSDAAGTAGVPWPSSNPSAVSSFNGAVPVYPNDPPNGYTNYYPPAASTNNGYNSYARGEFRQDNAYHPQNGYYQQQQPAYHQQQPGYYGPPGGGVKHMRHQSTPSASRSMQQQQMMAPPPVPAPTDVYGTPYGGGAAMYGRPQSYNTLAAVPAAPREIARAESESGSVNEQAAPAGELEGYPSAAARR